MQIGDMTLMNVSKAIVVLILVRPLISRLVLCQLPLNNHIFLYQIDNNYIFHSIDLCLRVKFGIVILDVYTFLFLQILQVRWKRESLKFKQSYNSMFLWCPDTPLSLPFFFFFNEHFSLNSIRVLVTCRLAFPCNRLLGPSIV